MEKITHKKQLILLTLVLVVFVFFAGWWLSFQSVVEEQGRSVQWYGGTYGLMALLGSAIGFFASKRWGGYKTILGRALLFFSLGLFAQEVGQLVYTYYVYGTEEGSIPYPSLGDVAYFGSVLLYIYATMLLGKAVGVRFSLKSNSSKVIAFIVPAVLLVVSYWILLKGHEYDTSNLLTVFLDFGYPMGQAVYISFAIVAYLLSRKMLGGVMRSGILLLIFALFVQYVSDFNFVYQVSRDTYLPGKYGDLLYLVSYMAMSVAMVKYLMISDAIRTKPASGVEKTPPTKG